MVYFLIHFVAITIPAIDKTNAATAISILSDVLGFVILLSAVFSASIYVLFS